jgi:hypothetical protein
LEAGDAGKKRLYNTEVWVKPWEDFKSLVEFCQVEDSESKSSIASDVTLCKGIFGLGRFDNIHSSQM